MRKNDSQVWNLLKMVAQRARLLDCLSENISDKRDLEDELGVSRSTINRAFRELEDEGILRMSRNGYELTLYGQLARLQYEDLTDAYTALQETAELTAHLPPSVSLDLRLLKGAKISRSNMIAPEQPFLEIKKEIRTAEAVKGYSPVAVPSYVDFFHEQIVDEGLDAELIFEEEVISIIKEFYPDELRAVLRSDGCIFWRTPKTPSFGLTIIDDEEVWVGVYQNGGSLRGSISNDTDAAVQWATETFDDYRESAEQVFLRAAIH